MRRGMSRCVVLLLAAFAVICASAQAATIPVTCGQSAALASAVTTANATSAPDTIEVTGGPCTFSLTAPAAIGANNNNTGLPIVTRPLTIDGNGSVIERAPLANLPFRILLASADGALTIRDLTIQHGLLNNGNVGAGVASFQASLVVENSTITANSTGGSSGGAAYGGGIATIGGSLLIDHSTIAFNTAPSGAGVATNLTGTTHEPVVVRRSLLLANTAMTSVGAAWVAGGVASFENVTFSGNAAADGIAGIMAGTPSGTLFGTAVNVSSSTFADSSRFGSTAPANALFAFVSAPGDARINVTDTIVTDSDSTAPATLAACAGSAPGRIVNDGGNLEWPGNTCGFGQTANPMISPLTSNGGPTQTHRLQPSSPAIDLGGSACPATDQRDVPRPDGDGCDAGAYESPAPETVAAGPSSSPTNHPALTFSSPDTPSATFQCRLDSGSFAPCTSPYEPSAGNGEHTVQVRAVAPGGYVDRSPAAATFVVDKSAPVVQISGPPAVGADRTARISFEVDDPGATVTCRVDEDEAVPCSSPFTAETLGDGSHTVTVTATDAAGNVGSKSTTFTVDTTPPVVDITGAPASPTNDPVAEIDFTVDDDDAAVTCQVDHDEAGPCSSPYTTDALGDGSHTVTVTATDQAGNAGSDTMTFTVDTVAPSTTDDVPAGWRALPVTVGLTATDEGSGVAKTYYTTDGSAPTTDSSVYSAAAPPVLEHGQAIRYFSTDAAGNAESVKTSAIAQVDALAPTVAFSGQKATYTVDETVRIACSATDPDPSSGLASDTCTDVDELAATLGVGEHTLSASAIDGVGRTATGSVTFTVSAPQPADVAALAITLLRATDAYAAMKANEPKKAERKIEDAFEKLAKAKKTKQETNAKGDARSLITELGGPGGLTAAQVETLNGLIDQL